MIHEPGWLLRFMHMDHILSSVFSQHSPISTGVFNSWPYLRSFYTIEYLTNLVQWPLSPRQIQHAHIQSEPRGADNSSQWGLCKSSWFPARGQLLLFLFLQQPSRKRERHRRGQSIICGVTCVTCSCLPPNLLSLGIHQGGCLPCSAAGELQPFFALSLGPQQIHCRCHHNHFLSRSLWCLPHWSRHFFHRLSSCWFILQTQTRVTLLK